MKAKSLYYKTIKEVDDARVLAESNSKQSKPYIDIGRRFFCGLSQEKNIIDRRRYSDDDDELLPHLEGIAFLNKHRAVYTSMIDSTNEVCQIHINTGDMTGDARASVEMSKSLNKHFFHYGTSFRNYVTSWGDEELLRGLAVSTWTINEWLPKVEKEYIFPLNTKMDVNDLSHWFVPKKLKVATLLRYQRESEHNEDCERKKGKSKVTYFKDKIDDVLKHQIEEVKKKGHSEIKKYLSFDDGECGWANENWEADAYMYYEKREDCGINITLYIPWVKGDAKKYSEIAVWETKEEVRADELIDFAVSSVEFAGDMTVDSAFGLAMQIYPHMAEMAEINDMAMDGIVDKLNSPLLKSPDMSDDEANKYDPSSMPVWRDGRLVTDTTSSGVGEALKAAQMLEQKAATILGSSGQQFNANREHSSQFKARDREMASVVNSLNSLRYKNFEAILEKSVIRILYLAEKGEKWLKENKPLDYEAIIFFLNDMKEEGIDFRKYKERLGARLRHMTVKADRIIAVGDPGGKEEAVNGLNAILPRLSPEAAQDAIYKIVALTNGADTADELLGRTERLGRIREDQEKWALLESGVIDDFSKAGRPYKPSRGDIAQRHIPIHFLKMDGILRAASYRRLTQEDILILSGTYEHCEAHADVLYQSGNKYEADLFSLELEEYRKVIGQYASIIANEIEEENSEREVSEMDFKLLQERRKLMDTMNKARQVDISEENLRRLKQNSSDNLRLKEARDKSNEYLRSLQLRLQNKQINKQYEDKK